MDLNRTRIQLTLKSPLMLKLEECFDPALLASIPHVILLKNTSATRIKQDEWMLCEENARKFERKIWSVFSRSEKVIIVIRKSVMLSPLYSLLIKLLITIKPMVSGLVRIECFGKFAISPLCMQTNGTVHVFGLDSLENVILEPMQVLKCENNALFLNLKIPSKIQMKNQKIM